MIMNLQTVKNVFFLTLFLNAIIALGEGENTVSADGQNVASITAGVEKFDFSFKITKEATEGAYELAGPMKLAAKANGGAELSYYFQLSLVDASSCDNITTVILNEAQIVRAMKWSDVAKTGLPAITVDAEDIYRSLLRFDQNCELKNGFAIEASLMTQPKVSMKAMVSGNVPEEPHVLASYHVPVDNDIIYSLKASRSEEVYEAYLTGGWSDKAYEPNLKAAIKQKLGYTNENVLVNIESFTYTNLASTLLNWYAYDMYRKSDGVCKYGYIYGEAATTSNGYSITRINGESHEEIDCSYFDQLKAQEK
jgi:hypothetical protein